jgi:hypothetical protein
MNRNVTVHSYGGGVVQDEGASLWWRPCCVIHSIKERVRERGKKTELTASNTFIIEVIPS